MATQARNPNPEKVGQLLAQGNPLKIKTQTHKEGIFGRVLDGEDPRGLLVHKQRDDGCIFIPWTSIESIMPVAEAEEEYQERTTVTENPVSTGPRIF
jgi:hypothetical protein